MLILLVDDSSWNDNVYIDVLIAATAAADDLQDADERNLAKY